MCSLLGLQGREWKTDRRSQQGSGQVWQETQLPLILLGSPGRLEGKVNVRLTSPDYIVAAAAVWDTAGSLGTRAGEHVVVIQRWWPKPQPKAAGFEAAGGLVVLGEGRAG